MGTSAMNIKTFCAVAVFALAFDLPAGTTDALLARIGNEKTVTLKAGEYRLDKTLVIDARHSDCTIRGATGGKTILSGARIVTSWRDEGNGLWSATVPWVSSRRDGFHHIVVNGVCRERAKAPDEGYFTAPDRRAPEYAGVGWMDWEYLSDKHRVAVERADAHPEWKLADADVVFYHFWNDSHAVPSAFEVDNDGKAWLRLSKSVRLSPCKALWRIENSLDVCNQPGEWVLAYSEKRLYYRPCEGEDMRKAVVEVPFLATLVRIEGAKNIRFENIVFADSRFELSEDDRNDHQAAYSTGAAIELVRSEGCAFERCTATRTDAYAFAVEDGSRGTRIRRCSLEHLGAGGVQISGGGCGWAYATLTGETFHTEDLPDPKTIVSDTEISDCTISDYGRYFAAGVGVLSRYAEKTAVVHNEICGGYYTGVSLGWSWGYHFTGLGGNTVAFNHIHDIGRGVLSDMGAVYTLGSQPGTLIANNVIHGVDARVYGGWGIYNDEGSSGITIENNLVYDTKYACYNLHYGRDIVIRNNVFAGGKNEQLALAIREKAVSLAFYNNIVWWREGRLMTGAWADTRPYEFQWFGNGARKMHRRTQGCLLDYNLYFNPGKAEADVTFGADYKYFENGGWPTYKGETDFAGWRERFKKDVHSLYADPLFVDPAKNDFRLKDGSPAFALGFRPIDFREVGPRK